jgi:hypothetical protein
VSPLLLLLQGVQLSFFLQQPPGRKTRRTPNGQ